MQIFPALCELCELFRLMFSSCSFLGLGKFHPTHTRISLQPKTQGDSVCKSPELALSLCRFFLFKLNCLSSQSNEIAGVCSPPCTVAWKFPPGNKLGQSYLTWFPSFNHHSHGLTVAWCLKISVSYLSFQFCSYLKWKSSFVVIGSSLAVAETLLEVLINKIIKI